MACACVWSRAPPCAQQMVSLKDMKTVKKARPWESTGAPCCIYCLESLVWGAMTKSVSGTVLDNITSSVLVSRYYELVSRVRQAYSILC